MKQPVHLAIALVATAWLGGAVPAADAGSLSVPVQ